MINKILIVCIGNICRSPMAEAILKNKLSQQNHSVSVKSAGLSALVGEPADPMAQELMLQRGIDISTHRAMQLAQKDIFYSDLVFTMSTEQQKYIIKLFPGAQGRIHRLGKWGEYDIVDPYKRPKIIFEQALHLIDQSINAWYEKLWAETGIFA